MERNSKLELIKQKYAKGYNNNPSELNIDVLPRDRKQNNKIRENIKSIGPQTKHDSIQTLNHLKSN